MRVCDFSAVQRGRGWGGGWGGGCRGTQIILQNRKTKETQSAPRERLREGMSNARRLLNRRPGREGERGARESGSECI